MGVNKVDLSTGETLIDISKDTVTPQTLAKGYTAHNSNGEQIVGTMTTEGGSSVEKLEVIDGTLDISTMSVTSMSHTHAQIKELINNGKTVVIRANAGIGYVFGSLVFHNLVTDRIGFQLMIQEDFGQGYMLYYFNMVVYPDGRINLTPYVVNLTGMGG